MPFLYSNHNQGVKELKKYYHVTMKENNASILEKGLIAQIGCNSEFMYEKENSVYLFVSEAAMKDALSSWLNMCFEQDWELVSFEVELPDDFILFKTNNEWEVRSVLDIPPSYIRFYGNERVVENAPRVPEQQVRWVMSNENVADVTPMESSTNRRWAM